MTHLPLPAALFFSFSGVPLSGFISTDYCIHPFPLFENNNGRRITIQLLQCEGIKELRVQSPTEKKLPDVIYITSPISLCSSVYHDYDEQGNRLRSDDRFLGLLHYDPKQEMYVLKSSPLIVANNNQGTSIPIQFFAYEKSETLKLYPLQPFSLVLQIQNA